MLGREERRELLAVAVEDDEQLAHRKGWETRRERQEGAQAADRSAALATELDHPNLRYFIEQVRKMKARLEQEPKSPG